MKTSRGRDLCTVGSKPNWKTIELAPRWPLRQCGERSGTCGQACSKHVNHLDKPKDKGMQKDKGTQPITFIGRSKPDEEVCKPLLLPNACTLTIV